MCLLAQRNMEREDIKNVCGQTAEDYGQYAGNQTAVSMLGSTERRKDLYCEELRALYTGFEYIGMTGRPEILHPS
jgi:hypothetical protein